MAKLGRQSPTQSVVLPYTRTKGAQAVKLYELTGRKIQAWQQLLLYDIMSYNDDELWVHVKFGYSLPRRNGKSEILAIRELWGLVMGEHIMHTAHRTTTTHAAWEKLCGWLDTMGLPYSSIRAAGRERIYLHDTGGRIDYRTRTSKGGLGEGVDLLVIDEAQEYQDDQESALKYIVTDSKNPQTLFCGTPPTPVSSGTVFTKLRSETFAGNTVDTGWAEWSVEKMTDSRDKDAWYETNPSLGTVFSERDITAELGTDDVDFNIQRLGLWIRYNLKSAIGAVEWGNLQVGALPALKGPLFAGVKYGKDGEHVALSIAVRTQDGRIFVEAIDCRPVRDGNGWMVDFLSKANVRAVVVDGANGQDLLVREMKGAHLKKPILPTVKEIVAANADFERGLYETTLCHMGQPSLVQAVTNCEKRAIGSNGGFGYKALKEGIEIALLDSVVLAHWACDTAKEPKTQKISV